MLPTKIEMPAPSEIDLDKVRKPIHLQALWFVGMALLVVAFLTAIILVNGNGLLPYFLLAVLAVIVVVFSRVIYLLQTEYRAEFLDDDSYLKFQESKNKFYEVFQPEIDQVATKPVEPDVNHDQSWDQREKERIAIYEKHRGLFLIHTSWPSQKPGQTADIAIRLFQNGRGPLTDGTVKSVEYHLGPKFSRKTITKTNAAQNFVMDVSAYGPMLCLAKVNFDDGTAPLTLERYINI